MTVKGLLDFLVSTEQVMPKGSYPIIRIIDSENKRYAPIYYIIGIDYDNNTILIHPKFTGRAYDGKDDYLYMPETTREHLIHLLTNTEIKPLKMDKTLYWFNDKLPFGIAGISFNAEEKQIIIDLMRR